jgi:capsular exopolysaccharide synthesis family protein
LKLVALTSAEPSEGKTATTANLAVVMAQLGRKVLVIDADLRRPRMHKVFRVSNRVGLVNFLTGPVDPKKIFFPTEVPNLMICPSGPIPPNPSELLSSERMREMLALVRSRFDFVLVDTPPALPVADAVILGPLMDGMVICARAGVLTRDDAKLCRERLSYADLRIFGTVLNRYRSPNQRYGKDYNYYGGYERAETPAPRTNAA